MSEELRYPWRCGCGQINAAYLDRCIKCGAEIGPDVERVSVEEATRELGSAPPRKPAEPGTPPAAKPPRAQRVVVVDFDVPIERLIALFVKCAFAAIPAGIIIGVVYLLFSAILLAAMRGS